MRTRIVALLVLPIFFFGSFSLAETVTKVLIFSAPFGSGHDTAAKRIKEIVSNMEVEGGGKVEVIVKNTLEFAPKFLADFALKNFSQVQTHMPVVYSFMFDNYLHKAYKVEHAGKMPLVGQLQISTKKMDAYIQEVNPDVIISTWPGSTEALIGMKRKVGSFVAKEKSRIKMAHVQTDNAAEDKYFQLFAQDRSGNQEMDMVFVPSREVFDEYVGNLGFKNVTFTGMPLIIKSANLPSYEQRESEKAMARHNLGLEKDVKTVMIEAGKNGAANYAVIIASILNSYPEERMNIIAACGDSESKKLMIEALGSGAARGTVLFKQLKKEMKELYNPKILKNLLKKGFSALKQKPVMTEREVENLIESGLPKNINLVVKGFVPLEPLRAASDVVLTKPGGLSTAELGAEGRPMIILQEYASGEALPNGPLFARKNLAVINRDISTIGKDVAELLSDASRLQSMYASASKFRKEFDLGKVVPFVKSALPSQNVVSKNSCLAVYAR
jgi:UDP-N-acetylglucosamine:LPS N-acetylglucosamine transferase